MTNKQPLQVITFRGDKIKWSKFVKVIKKQKVKVWDKLAAIINEELENGNRKNERETVL